MLAVLFTLGLFVVWSMFGVAALATVRADLAELRVALTAPILGTALAVIPLFVLSVFNVSMRSGGPPVFILLLVASIVVLVWRRPRLPLAVAPVILLCLVDLVVLGWPMFTYGFDWLANANGDMAFYVLAATHLKGHGIGSPVNFAALADNRDFASSAQSLDSLGLRPGIQITLAALSSVTGRQPVTLYMPMALSATMAGVCATGALGMQASRKWWVASVAAALLVASPLAGYGVLQELVPQNWGLGLSAALFAWLMRPQLYEGRRVPLPDLCMISVLAAGAIVAASEVAVALLPGYVLYVALLVARRRVSLRALALLWGVPLAFIALVHNTYLPRTISYLTAIFGIVGSSKGVGTLFAYALVPTALPASLGIRSLFAPPTARDTWEYILPAAFLLGGVIVACVISTLRGAAAAAILAGNFALALLLIRSQNDFGLFKLYMYAQPFLAATVAVFLSGLTSRRALGLASAVVAIVVVAQVPVLTKYVEHSRNPVDLRDASASGLLPKFRRIVRDTNAPVVPISDNFALVTLFGASAGDRRLYFVSRNVFNAVWKKQRFAVPPPASVRTIGFRENVAASRILSKGNCVFAFPTGSQLAMNRRVFPEGSADLLALPCRKAKNDLIYVVSALGAPFSLPQDSRLVSFWQLEPDPSFSGRTFSGFGRYALFQVVGGTPGARAVLTLTTSPTQGNRGSRTLPAASIAGDARVEFPLVGSGSARVISPPLHPQLIDGREYVLLDMGRSGQYQPVPRPGLTGLWAKSALLDPRRLTSYVRDISLISASDYRRLTPPAAIHRFPADLANPGLEYSGIFEDGWLSGRSYAVLAGGDASTLRLKANVLTIPGQHLEVTVNGKPVLSKNVQGGNLQLSVPLPASPGLRRIELQWARTIRLGVDDPRQAAALLTFLGSLSPPSKIGHFPADLRDKTLVYSGIYDDGWVKRVSSATLAGGAAATLVVHTQVPEARGQRLVVRVNGKQVADAAARPGRFDLRVPVPASPSSRKIDLVWAITMRLRAPDTRHAAALLKALRLEARQHS